MVKAIVGANWGDEGKGKITDLIANQSDFVVRFQGGSNAGHTIINDYGKFALHQLPSGIFTEGVTNIIANGVALNIDYLMEEIAEVRKAKKDINLIISNRAQILLPHHVLLDTYEEERLGDKKFGSTKSGIAPFFADKFSKVGIQVWEIYDNPELREKVNRIYDKVNITLKHLYGKEEINPNDVYNKLMEYRETLKYFVKDTSKILRNAIKENKLILLEGQLGALKDTDHGIYPYVTSSSTLAGYGAVGAGIAPYSIEKIVAVTKAYSSAVGEGPFVVELFGEEGNSLRERGGDAGEYGATTGRARRVGYFDCVATRYGVECQGATDVALTAIDVLGYLDEIPVCVAYEIDGKITKDFDTTYNLYNAKPVYEYLPSWSEDIRGITNYNDLPENAKKYVSFIEKEIGVKISTISTGPKRHEIITDVLSFTSNVKK
ncbi:MAG: adenylosuccinate synthase [Lachnospirales bacterium]